VTIAVLLLLLGEPDAAARLAEIRGQFAARPQAESEAALEVLAQAAAATEAGGEAAAWRGALARHDGDYAGAARWFAATQAAPPGGAARRLGERGLGDLDLLQHRYTDAQRHYAAAARGADGALGAELTQMRALAERLQRRLRLEWVAWIFLVLVLGHLVARAWRGRGPLELPVEAIYVAPVYALLVIGCLGRESNVLEAMTLAGVASLVLIATAGVAASRSPPEPRLRWLQVALLVGANVALFYAILNRLGLVETLLETVQQ
jgi:hypothetical protein